MKNFLVTLLILLAPILLAQPTITNAGNFPIGTILKFRTCNPDNVIAGSGGANQVWDFSGLTPIGDTLVTSIVSPSITTWANMFPQASIVERNSDETTNYLVQSQGKTYLAGYVDTSANLVTINYTDPVQLQQNPITLGTSVSDNYRALCALSSVAYYKGSGSGTIEGDGYGTLITPTGTYSNVLRVKITQMESDSINGTNTIMTLYNTAHVYFDGIHNSSLMMIDSSKSGNRVIKTVKYLVSETNSNGTVGIPTQSPVQQLRFFPNPAHESISITAPEPGTVQIRDMSGQLVRSGPVTPQKNTIAIQGLCPGIYIIELRTSGLIYRNKLNVD